MDWIPEKKFTPHGRIEGRVPASKSILNRALLLAALSRETTFLETGDLCEDTRNFLTCLRALGIEIKPQTGGFSVRGCNGEIPDRRAKINVGNAGTAARFLPIVLAFSGGDYTVDASEQMRTRPMEFLPLLEEAGVKITYPKSGVFPFRLQSNGISVDHMTVNTDTSTQYASGVLLAASALKRPFTLTLTGKRTNGSYLRMTKEMLRAFRVPVIECGNSITVSPAASAPLRYRVEPDLSTAAYFYALALLFRTQVLVSDVHSDTLQGDFRFLKLLEEKGVRFEERTDGLLLDGSAVSEYDGFDADLKDCSDQTLTLAALAVFATSPSRLRGVGHIKRQESDRLQAICKNLTALGVNAASDGDGVMIVPSLPHAGKIDSMGDHRVAMAFSLIALKTGNVTICGADCCKKTFENYFDILDELIGASSPRSF